MIQTAKATLGALLCACAAFPAVATGQSSTPPNGDAYANFAETGGTLVPDPNAARLQAQPSAMLGRKQRIAGKLTAANQASVLIQRSDSKNEWVTVARAKADARGEFSTTWKADRTGRITLRALRGGLNAASTSDIPTTSTTVYRSRIATYYGPGLFGRRTACGQKLTTKIVGVAHKTLPCGTLIEFYYRGRTVQAPVIDRGPYANNATWDLTSATAEQLGLTATSSIGAITVGHPSLIPPRSQALNSH